MDDLFGVVLNAASANNAWSASQAQKQMDFQERMSSTAHQREVADLKAAGLNPVLSAGGNGASSPTGAMGDVDQSLVNGLVEVLKNFGEGIAFGAASGAGSARRVAEDHFDSVVSTLSKDFMNNGKTFSSTAGYPDKFPIEFSSLPGSVLSRLLPAGEAKNAVKGFRDPAFAALDAILNQVVSNTSLKNAIQSGNYQMQGDKVKIKNTDGTYTIFPKGKSQQYLEKYGRKGGTTVKSSGFSSSSGSFSKTTKGNGSR